MDDPTMAAIAEQLSGLREDLAAAFGWVREHWGPEATSAHATLAAHDRALGPTVDEFNLLVESLQRRCDQLRDERDQCAGLLLRFAAERPEVLAYLAAIGVRSQPDPSDAPHGPQ